MNIESSLNNFVQHFFGKDFQYRNGQREIILDILNFYTENPEGLYLLDAPTGAGKSIIGMAVAGALAFEKKRGYILASDLSLQEQYENDINKFNMPWGSIKGVDNYTCDVNYEKFSLGDCRVRNMAMKDIRNLHCYSTCGYYSNRAKAITSPVSLLNYAYWLIQRNYVAPKVTDEPFEIRDFTICDEAHKITEIVQNHFSPSINDATVSRLENLRDFISKEFNMGVMVDREKLQNVISQLFKEEDNSKLMFLLSEFEHYLGEFVKKANASKDYIGKTYKGRDIPRNLWKGLSLCDWVKDLHCKFEDYNMILTEVGGHMMVKNPSTNKIVFNCIEEGYMMGNYFHSQAKFRLMMTATMGSSKDFIHNIRANGAIKYKRIDSNFDFSNSPIYFYSKRKMSINEKDKTLPWIYETINKVLDKHSEESGIIHSASYDITNKIFENLAPRHRNRVLIYQDSEEKREILRDFNNRKNAVLMGPSILEGLDLSQDKSRFQVFAKVPYPNLQDRYVKAKIKAVPSWYNWKSIIAILQGVGRSVRSQEDWAITYFLDGNLADLMHSNRSAFPQEFKDRLRIIKT
jgi:ATP-dependent DNA helicase DinG